mgnify:CR=1 FL=1
MATWPAVLDELVRTRRAALVGYATLLTGDPAAAEDVVHDAIVKAFSRGRRFTHVNKADAYVRRAIVSVFIDRARREQRFRDAAPGLVGGGFEAAPEAAVDLERALASLTPQLRAVTVLRFHDDLTVPQIADRMGIADGTVKRYLHEAQALLAVIYRSDLEQADAAEASTVSVVAHGKRTTP